MSTELQVVATEAATCVRCGLAETRTQVVFGVGDPHADLLFVGEGPGADEDRLGEPFVGRSGKLLDQLVWEEMGLTRDGFYIANVVKCRPPDNRDPRPKDGITKVRGRSYPFGAAVLIPTFHPAAILRGGAQQMAQMRADLVRAKQALGVAPVARPSEAPSPAPAPEDDDIRLFD